MTKWIDYDWLPQNYSINWLIDYSNRALLLTVSNVPASSSICQQIWHSRPQLIYINFDFLDQTFLLSCQIRLSWSNFMSFMSNSTFIYVKFDFLDHTSYYSWQIWHSWPTLVSVMWKLTFLTKYQVIHVIFDVLHQILFHSCQI
jgi:hypothetical protein